MDIDAHFPRFGPAENRYFYDVVAGSPPWFIAAGINSTGEQFHLIAEGYDTLIMFMAEQLNARPIIEHAFHVFPIFKPIRRMMPKGQIFNASVSWYCPSTTTQKQGLLCVGEAR